MPRKSTSKNNKLRTTKLDQIVIQLNRNSGASIPELVKATAWQAHSIRGFLSGHVKKKLGLEISSSSEIGKDRRYRIQDAA